MDHGGGIWREIADWATAGMVFIVGALGSWVWQTHEKVIRMEGRVDLSADQHEKRSGVIYETRSRVDRLEERLDGLVEDVREMRSEMRTQTGVNREMASTLKELLAVVRTNGNGNGART